MKKNIYLLTSVLLLIFSSCHKTNVEMKGFEMSYKRKVLPYGLVSDTIIKLVVRHDSIYKNIAADTALFFNLNNASLNQIKKVFPKKMVFNKYANIQTIVVSIFDPNRPNLGEKIIFSNANFSTNEITLEPHNIDVSNFLFGSKEFAMRVQISFYDFISRSLELEWAVSFFACQDNCQ